MIKKEWKCARPSYGVTLSCKIGWFHWSYLNLSFGELTSLLWNCSTLSWCVCPRVGWSDMLVARLPWSSDQDPLPHLHLWFQPCRFENFFSLSLFHQPLCVLPTFVSFFFGCVLKNFLNWFWKWRASLESIICLPRVTKSFKWEFKQKALIWACFV